MPRLPGTRRGRVGWLVLAGVVGAWWLSLAPSSLGGPVTPLLTRGVSMAPTYTTGDLVIGYRDRSPDVGDVLVARHTSGALVVHRVVGRDADGYITRGDNQPLADPWRTRPEDVLGTARISVGGVGDVLAVLQRPVALGALAATAVLALVGLSAELRSERSLAAPSAALVLVAAAIAVALGPGLTAWMPVTSDDVLALDLTYPTGLEPTYQVTVGGGGGCPPRKPTC